MSSLKTCCRPCCRILAESSHSLASVLCAFCAACSAPLVPAQHESLTAR